MTKFEMEVAKLSLQEEKAILKELEKQYKEAMKAVDTKIAELLARTDVENMSSIIYQLKYQKAIKAQIWAVLDDLKSKQYVSIMDYLQRCYQDGYTSVMYYLKSVDIPIIFPIDQEQVIKAIMHDTKLSQPLYDRLGQDINELKKNIRSTISRGIANNESYSVICRNIRIVGDVFKNKAYRIARTEGHRITQEATYDSQLKAKDAGADIVKQWDAALDKRTRRAHAELDGKIVDVDEEFEYNGHKALYPGGFGVASLDINCRCVITQRAKWALGEEELNVLKERAAYYGLDKTKDFKEFKEKYLSSQA